MSTVEELNWNELAGLSEGTISLFTKSETILTEVPKISDKQLIFCIVQKKIPAKQMKLFQLEGKT